MEDSNTNILTNIPTNYIRNYDNIIKLLQTYIYCNQPIFSESFNDGYPTEDTYILQIKTIIRPRIIEVLKMLQFRNESYLSYDEKDIHGISFKSYAFYKEKIIKNGKKKFIFCLENDKNCRGILLSSIKV
jgi:hypothetical protein